MSARWWSHLRLSVAWRWSWIATIISGWVRFGLQVIEHYRFYFFVLPNYVIFSNIDLHFDVLGAVKRSCEVLLRSFGVMKQNVGVYGWNMCGMLSLLRAKHYGFCSDMLLFFNIFNQFMLSENESAGPYANFPSVV